MLLELNIRDFALIKNLSLSFGRGLNILTGETGAGKSIIIDSCMAALGARTRGDVVRAGAETASIELVFGIEEETMRRLRALDIYPESDGILIVSRRISGGRNICRVGGETVTLRQLRKITDTLIDIYGQNEYHTLLDTGKHLAILDSYIRSELGSLPGEVRSIYGEFRKLEESFSGYSLDEGARLREQDILSYEASEIDSAGLREGEEEKLEKDYRRLSNERKISELLSGAYKAISDTNLERAAENIHKALKYDENLGPIYDELLAAQSVLTACQREIGNFRFEAAYSGEELQNVTERLDLIRSLERKFGNGIKEVLDYREKIGRRLSELEHYEEGRILTEKKLSDTRLKLEDLCGKLSLLRKKGAEKLTELVTEELSELGFQGALISMEFRDTAPSETGCDEARFMASLNPGEPMKPLSEIGSGGELSRVMLALKAVLARTDDMPTLIFDEIDSGISGRTALKVAEKMAQIARTHQVIAVSHLAQIASMADTHFVIEKKEAQGRHVTTVEKLDYEGRVEEIARILGGESSSGAARTNAAEMLERASSSKEKYR